METKRIGEYLLIEKKDKTGLAMSLNVVEGFDFGRCVCELDGDVLRFEPTQYSSTMDIEIALVKESHREMVLSYDRITIAQVKASGEFGDIYEIEID